MRRVSFEIWLIVLVMLSHLYVALVPADSLMHWFPSDDAFYYFKTAQNIAEGHGITFDGLGRDSGFHPLWMAVITPIFSLAHIDRILPLRLVVLLAGVLNAGTALLLYRLTRRFLTQPAAVLIALFWAFFPAIHQSVIEIGLESAISAFFIVWLIYRVAKTRLVEPVDGLPTGRAYRELLITGLIGALTVLARLDNIFLVLVMGLWVAIRPVRMRYLLVSDIALIGLGILWSFMVRVGFGPQYAQASTAVYWMLAAGLIIRVGIYYLLGLYEQPGPGWVGLAVQLGKAAAGVLFGTVLLSGIMLGAGVLQLLTGFPRLVLAYEGGFALAAVLASRLAATLLIRWTKPTEEPFCWLPTLARLTGYFVPLGFILVIYMGASLWYFGTPMPVSGQIKRWWGTLPNPIYGRPVQTFSGLLGLWPGGGPWSLIINAAALPGFIPAVVRYTVYGLLAAALLILQRRHIAQAAARLALFPLFAGCFIQLISYTGTGYLHMRNWYWTAPTIFLTLMLGMLADAGLCWLAERKLQVTWRERDWELPTLISLGLCIAVVIYGSYRIEHRIPPTVPAGQSGRFLIGMRLLEGHTEPGSIIGSTGGGVTAYFINDRTMVNLDGLMNTNTYFKLLQAGRASDYLDQIGMKYIYATEYVVTSSDPYFQFKGKYEKISDFGGATLFRWK